MALPINFNPSQPIPNTPFYSDPAYTVQGPVGPLIVGSNLSVSPTGYLSASGGGGSGTVTFVGTGTGLIGGPITGSGTISLDNTSVISGAYSYASFTVDAQGRLTAASNGIPPVTSVSVSAPLATTGGLTPTIFLSESPVTPGSYFLSNITVDNYGRVTSASSGSAVTSVDTGAGLIGGPITSTGIVALDVSGVAAATYAYPSSLDIDQYGRVTSATSGAAPIPCSALTSCGSILSVDASSVPTALPLGTTGDHVLTIDFACPLGMKWAAGGSVTNVSGVAPVQVATGSTTPVISVDPASTTAPGIVQLYNATDNPSTTLALTAAQGKSLQDQIDALSVSSNLVLAGTLNASTGLVDSVTAAGTAAGFAVGSPLPVAAVGNANYFVIADVAAASYTPPGGVSTQVHIGDWFLSDGTSWQFLDVGFQAAYATTSAPGVVQLATDLEVQTGSNTTNAVVPSSLQSKISNSVSTTSSTTIASSTAVKTAYDAGILGQTNAAAAQATANAAIPCASITAKGVLLGGTGAATFSALPVGTNGQVLTADSACVTGLKWASASATPQATPIVLGTVLGCTLLGRTALGCNALRNNTGAQNTGLGYNALCTNSTGQRNTAVGESSMLCNFTGSFNTAIGHSSLQLNTGGCLNSAIGGCTLCNNTTGNCNTAVGGAALRYNTLGIGNTATGTYSLYFNGAGNGNAAFGNRSLFYNTSGGYNTAIGDSAGCLVTTGCRNVLIGSGVDAPTPTSCCSLAIGFDGVGGCWLTGNSNKTIKPGAGIEDCAGSCGTAGQVLMSNGANAVCWGTAGGGSSSATPLVEGIVYGCATTLTAPANPSTTSLGFCALRSLSTGSGNTAVGTRALRLVSTGSFNTVIGCNGAAALTTDSYNVVVGSSTMQVATGSYNVAVGESAAFGVSGNYNIAIGLAAMNGSSNGCNIAIGARAMENVLNGVGNIEIGGNSSTSERNPVFNLVNENDRVVLGSNATTDAYIKVAWTVVSDARDKIVEGDVPLGLEFVEQLEPKSFWFKTKRDEDTPNGPKRYGFLAQDILALEGADPVIIDADDSDHLRYRGEALVPVLVNALKELSAEVKTLRSQVESMETVINLLKQL